MRFGLVLPIMSTDDDLSTLFEQLRETVQAADRAGFDSVLLPEFHQSRGGALVSPLLIGAALLQGTSTIRFGPAVLATPLHHPVRLAEDIIMLDHITRGRVVLGLGIGHQHPDFAVYGIDRDTRVSRTEEIIEILGHCFAGESFEFHGQHFDLQGQITPAAYTQPRPEIWMGAHAPAGLERAGRLADLWLCDPQRDIDTVAGLAQKYRAEAERHGRPARVGLFREAWIGDSREECEEVWAPNAMQVHRLYYNVGVYLEEFEPWVSEVTDRKDFTLDRLAPGRFLYGSPEEVRATVIDWCALTGADYLALRMRHPGGPGHAATLAAIERYGDEVLGPLGARADRSA